MYSTDGLQTGVIYRDDNLNRLRSLPPECIDLIYLDPPFFSNRNYEVIWGDESEVRSFEDRWTGGIDHYIRWMRQRVMEMRRVLKPTGSIYLHCDAKASHYLKVMMDRVFGSNNFRNEIIWRRTASNNSAKRFGPIHQTILFYGKSSTAPFYNPKGPYTRAYVEKNFTHVDGRGRYRPVLLTGPGRRQGESGQPWRGYDPTDAGRHWQPASYLYRKYAQLTGQDLAQWPLLGRLDKLDEVGLIHWGDRQGNVPNYKFYLKDAPGVPLQDIWAFQPGTEGCVYGRSGEGIDEDVKWLGSNDRERLGYPTQKPEGLLKRIIEASSQKGDVVLDPFCGCGTTVTAAERLGRRWIGIDISLTAVEIMRVRLAKAGAKNIRAFGIPENVDDLRELKPFEFENWVIRSVDGQRSPRQTGDMGIDGFSFLDQSPIQVKRQDSVGRGIVDNFETAIERYGAKKGHIVAFSFTSGAHDEVARAEAERGLEIELVTVQDLLLGTSELVAPVLNRRVLDMPLPKAPPKEARPTAEELVESDQHSEEVA